jgi:hypothetical protein
MTIKRKCGKCRLHVLATSASDRLTARELMVFWVLDLDLRISLSVFSGLVLTSWSDNAARTKAKSRCKRHSRRATQSAGITRRCVEEGEKKEDSLKRDDIVL